MNRTLLARAYRSAPFDRREFFERLAGYPVAAGGACLLAKTSFAGEEPVRPPNVPDHTLTVISGSPRERGRQYGRKFGSSIARFLDQEIYTPYAKIQQSRDEMLRYAGACYKTVQRYSPVISDELEGMAQGSGLRLEEIVLATQHEEHYHRGLLPSIPHCTAIAVGPPDTGDGDTYVGQSWDWFNNVFGWSSMLLWKRPEGPSVLAYSYPGLWVSAGLNSAGVALCWTSTDGLAGAAGPRVGIPTYVLIAQMLYQPSLDAAVEEVRRAEQAGWFTFLLADKNGRLVNVESSPRQKVVEFYKGHVARTYYGTRQMTGTPEGTPVKFHPQVQRMYDLLDGSAGRLDRAKLQGFYGDHRSTICKHYGPAPGGGSTLDVMLFNTTTREALITRGPACQPHWQRFSFETG